MFISNKNKKKIDDRLFKIEADLIMKYFKGDDFRICEICRCIILKTEAIKGNSEIRVRDNRIIDEYGFPKTAEEEYIYTPYYCKKCNPNEPDTETDQT